MLQQASLCRQDQLNSQMAAHYTAGLITSVLTGI